MTVDIYTNATQDSVNREEYVSITLINAYRRDHGLPELQVSKTLSLVAGRKALDRFENVTTYSPGGPGENAPHGWSDQPYNGNVPGSFGAIFDSARKFGIDFDIAGEVTTANLTNMVDFKISNVIQGDVAVDRWKGSPSHDALLLNPDFAQVGVGIHGGVAYAVFSYWSDPLGPADVIVDYDSSWLGGTPHADRFVIIHNTGTVDGGAGDDIFHIDAHAVSAAAIAGGGGNDIVVLDIDRAHVAIANHAWGVDSNVYALSGNGFTYTIDDVELVRFNDGNLALGGTNAYAFLYRLYDAAFNRAPDESGFDYWANRLLDGSIGRYNLAAHFVESDEFRLLYGENTSNSDFIDALYRNVFEREADPDGRQYWISRLDEGYNRTGVVNDFVDSLEHKVLTYDEIAYGLWFG